VSSEPARINFRLYVVTDRHEVAGRDLAEIVARLGNPNAASDAGPKPGIKPDAAVKDPDAGPEPIRRAPEAAAEVAVGAKALDHHGQGLLFIDDDAPCYVRVAGKDAARRLELARLIAKNLTLANAPMTPRALR